MDRNELINDMKEIYANAFLESYGIDLRKGNEKKADVISEETSALLNNANSDEEVALAIKAAMNDRVDYVKNLEAEEIHN